MLYFSLGPSLTHDTRECCLAPVRSDWCDGYMIIKMGSPGPRGGRSKLRRDGYFLQEVEPDPQFRPHGWREFLLAKDGRSAEVYQVDVPPPGYKGRCTCEGFRKTGGCKHSDAIYHLARVVGWTRESSPLVGGFESELFGARAPGFG